LGANKLAEFGWVRLFRVAQEADLRWPTPRAFVADEEVSRMPS
jgi:hypothetical protein